MSATDGEHHRIIEVYTSYGTDRANQHRWSANNAGNARIIAERAKRTKELAEPDLASRVDGVMLDIGCGTGADLERVSDALGHRGLRVGIDLRRDALSAALAQASGTMVEGSVLALPFADESVDIVSQSVVVSSILDAGLRRTLAAEVERVVKPGGLVLSYDMRVTSRRNRNVTKVSRSDLRALFPSFAMRVASVSVAPPNPE